MYEAPQGLWGFGTWVNGGHWTTCEARALMAYYRLGKYEDARRSMKKMLTFARQFRMDNPLVDFGNAVYQPREPINLTYDAFGAPAGPDPRAVRVSLQRRRLAAGAAHPRGHHPARAALPHPLRNQAALSGGRRQRPHQSVRVNGKRWKSFDADSVFLPYQSTPELAAIQIIRGRGGGQNVQGSQVRLLARAVARFGGLAAAGEIPGHRGERVAAPHRRG